MMCSKPNKKVNCVLSDKAIDMKYQMQQCGFIMGTMLMLKKHEKVGIPDYMFLEYLKKDSFMYSNNIINMKYY